MRTARSRNIPPTPRSLNGLADILTEYPPMFDIYKGCATGLDGSVALIFIHNSMLVPLSECTQIFCDGTFKVNVFRIFY